MSDTDIDNETLRILCQYSLSLVKLRQSDCKHLATENHGPETLRNVLQAYYGDQIVNVGVELDMPPMLAKHTL